MIQRQPDRMLKTVRNIAFAACGFATFLQCNSKGSETPVIHYEVVSAGQVSDSLSAHMPYYKQDLKDWKSVYAACLLIHFSPMLFTWGCKQISELAGSAISTCEISISKSPWLTLPPMAICSMSWRLTRREIVVPGLTSTKICRMNFIVSWSASWDLQPMFPIWLIWSIRIRSVLLFPQWLIIPSGPTHSWVYLEGHRILLYSNSKEYWQHRETPYWFVREWFSASTANFI